MLWTAFAERHRLNEYLSQRATDSFPGGEQNESRRE